MFNIENLEITAKCGEGDLPRSNHIEKAMVNILFYFFLVLLLSTLFLMVLKGVLPGKAIKKTQRNVTGHYEA